MWRQLSEVGQRLGALLPRAQKSLALVSAQRSAVEQLRGQLHGLHEAFAGSAEASFARVAQLLGQGIQAAEAEREQLLQAEPPGPWRCGCAPPSPTTGCGGCASIRPCWGEGRVDPDGAGDAHACRLGQTLDGLDQAERDPAHYGAVVALHRAFHADSAALAARAREGAGAVQPALAAWLQRGAALSAALEAWAKALDGEG